MVDAVEPAAAAAAAVAAEATTEDGAVDGSGDDPLLISITPILDVDSAGDACGKSVVGLVVDDMACVVADAVGTKAAEADEDEGEAQEAER